MEIQNKELHRIVTTVLLYKPDFTYLITKRALHKKVQPGKWTIPGGGLSTDDYIHTPSSTADGKQWYGSVEISMRREIREEVSCEFGKPELLTDLTFIQPDGTPVLILSYFAPYVSGEIMLDTDATEYAWVSAEQAKEYDLIDGVLGEIQEVDLILRSRV